MLDTVSSMWRIPSVDLYPHSSLLSGHEKTLMREIDELQKVIDGMRR